MDNYSKTNHYNKNIYYPVVFWHLIYFPLTLFFVPFPSPSWTDCFPASGPSTGRPGRRSRCLRRSCRRWGDRISPSERSLTSPGKRGQTVNSESHSRAAGGGNAPLTLVATPLKNQEEDVSLCCTCSGLKVPLVWSRFYVFICRLGLKSSRVLTAPNRIWKEWTEPPSDLLSKCVTWCQSVNADLCTEICRLNVTGLVSFSK